MQYATFSIDDHLYGIPILTVREISRFFTITPVQGADERIEGLLNLRGQIVTVLNLGRCIHTKPVPLSSESRIIILKREEELSREATERDIHTALDTLALLVDQIGDVVDAVDEDVEPAPPHLSSSYVSGIIKKSGELLTLLSTEWLCKVDECEGKMVVNDQ